MDRQTRPGRANKLAGQPSAYLRQHAGNPVDWQPFGEPAFAEARLRDVPVFLSVGYAACHWCHVMAHESFEDAAIADYLNAHFVSVKVDREERPDVDSVYLTATQVISGQGGWPMSVFLNPDGLAFHAGTYFPPRPVAGRASFRQVLEAVVEAWTQRRDQVERSAAELARSLATNPLGRVSVRAPETLDAAPALEPGLESAREPRGTPGWVGIEGPVRVYGGVPPVGREITVAAVELLGRSEDPNFSGFGGAPKFPPSPLLEFLIRHAAGNQRSANEARGMAARTLSAMSSSALFDQIDGGFARYSVNEDWSVPHFEKMLYDNAALTRVFAHWLRLPDAPDLPHLEAKRVLRQTASWLHSGLRLPGGAFASSLDADTVVEGVHEEGASYLWTPKQLQAAATSAGAPELGPRIAAMMNVRVQGTVTAEGSALHPGTPLSPEDRDSWDRVAPELSRLRARRPQPGRDEKVVAGWNGLAIAALADAGLILNDTALVAAATQAADYLQRVHWNDGVLTRVSFDGMARGIGGLLEDYAFTADGLLALYAATGVDRWYRLAEELIIAAGERFVIDGMLADSAAESEQVFNAQGRSRSVDPFDGPTASGSSAFASALLSYAGYSGSSRHRAMAEHILSTVPSFALRAPRVAGWSLAAAEALLAGPVEVAITGPEGPARSELIRAAALSGSPGLILAVGGSSESSVPLLAGRAAAGVPMAYVCEGMVCQRPVATVQDLQALLQDS
ncbi:thioredoxin domain-containing protein [Paenarthrobacter sp. Z7-10]|uniref:thioredoxin domain-containing protein n=1 Tax=Paenarthrobacter sp. Z7-10 TaxID=2787635 RepID=UPI0022A97960|nr:thioredoxin domain-containing protein [Paenarthrobacter sp. Z7-10]MCZ2404426.1 thioredoxin domain-containing protein [Paenarthrobacter sp. Z7-10]